MGNSSITIIE